jgi:hypothetical protein
VNEADTTASERKFYQTEYRITVLSEEPLDDPISLEDIIYEISEGHCLGRVDRERAEEISSKRCAQQCEWAGSDAGFFELDEEGNDFDEA